MIPAPRQVICAGNVVFDILVRPVGDIEFGKTAWVDSIEQHMGGNGANTSYTLARLGVPVALHSIVGRDDFGDQVRRRLIEAGVDIAALQQSEAATASTVALVHASGARAFLHRPGVSHEAFPEPIRFFPAEESHFHLANVFALPKLRGTAPATIAAARKAGYTTSLDTGWDARGEWRTIIDPLLPFVDLLFLNEDEGRMLSGEHDEQEIGRSFLARGVGSVVLKLGARGCLLFDQHETTAVPAFAVNAVDTTGAGDCFAGGFLAALHHGHSPVEAARFANAVGALSIQRLGSTAGVSSYEETRLWMAAQ